ncbi:MAG: helix-turn-helix domain-containing protein [Pegethrix bostrychoides GSE-TBD4-15B]|uniref:Helix-turn-helix domain-containing protein n=1 Tax=Pegethrix bostrychoides GSE-TBD4-15B TaxID=2839662 RepID=A0A951PAA4_9CYAN|nr:helix-turn-helix domain-containing protein [Pegethrix bostrychoides GSE-TBD4-15B]
MELLPKDELLKDYIKRIRELKGLTRLKLAKLAAVHVSTIARIESGSTGAEKPRREVQERICKALQIPVEYMQASAKGQSVSHPQTNKVCLSCWVPGSSPDIRWSEVDARFCLKCGAGLRDQCERCKEPILLRGRFCPGCGSSYKRD